MRQSLTRSLILLSCIVPTSSLLAQANTQKGVAVGGITGAIAGGIIGDNNGEAGAGAAIGGVIGAVTGGLIGNASDKEAEYRRQQAANRQYQQQFAYSQSAVSIGDVISMSRSGLSENIIVNQINTRGVQAKLQVSDIIALHEQGVSERVITTMQTAPTGPTRLARQPTSYEVVRPAPVVTAPVIVEERYIVPHYAPRRSYYYRSPHHYHHRHHGFHIRF